MTVPQIVIDGIERLKRGDDTKWSWFSASREKRDEVDGYLVYHHYAMAYEAGTQEQRFRRLVCGVVEGSIELTEEEYKEV